VAQINSSHLEKDNAIAEHELKLGQLRREVQQITKEKEQEEAELSRLKHACSRVEEACGKEQMQFRSILDELQQKHMTAQVPKLT
jgi:chromosome segregation ATPase